jgi:hypothetical protein
MPGLGKTYLACEFIRRHGTLFDSVYQLDCQEKDLEALMRDLASQMGILLDIHGKVDQAARDLRRYLSAKRCLLFLDNVESDEPGALLPEGRAAVLVTSRNRTIPFFADCRELNPPLFSDSEALDLFRQVVGTVAEEPAKQLFLRLGHLPIAVAVCAGLIKNNVHYTVESLLAALPPLETLTHGKNNVGLLLRKAIGAVGKIERSLLVAMSTCAPGSVRLGFAAEIAGLSEADSLNALQGLYSRSLVVELDRVSRRYRLHTLIREATCPPEELNRNHEFELYIDFDRLLDYQQVREFEWSYFASFRDPPFVRHGFRVDPPIKITRGVTAPEESPKHQDATLGKTSSTIVAKGWLRAADSGEALQIIAQSSFHVWSECNPNPMMKVIVDDDSRFMQHHLFSLSG